MGAGQSALGAIGYLVAPLRVARSSPPTEDACVDLDAARAALATTAKNERSTFFANHVGSLVVTAGGALLLAYPLHAPEEGLASAALGYPVSLFSLYTQPRAAWHAERQVGVAVARGAGGGPVVVVSGSL